MARAHPNTVKSVEAEHSSPATVAVQQQSWPLRKHWGKQMLSSTMSAVHTGNQSSTKGFADVTDFVEAHDGLDRAPAIARALDSLEASGGVLHFPPGIYYIYSPVVLTGKHGITLQGTGMQSTVLVAETHSMRNKTMITFNGSTYCGLEKIKLTYQGWSSGVLPVSGSALWVTQSSFWISMRDLVIEGVWAALTIDQDSNTVTMADTHISTIYGPSAIKFHGGRVGKRVDILQLTRVIANNPLQQNNVPDHKHDPKNGNEDVVWIDIGAGANTVRLDNVGLVNGGIAIKMSSPEARATPGVDPGRPLFVFCNDLEIDFPKLHAIHLAQGESFLCSNCYIQGAQNNGHGVFADVGWDSELQILNSRIFGNTGAGVVLAGGRRALLSNNIIGHSNAGNSIYPGVLVFPGVSNFVVTGNQIGPVFGDDNTSQQLHGIEIRAGESDNYVVTNNILVGSKSSGLLDGGTGSKKSVMSNVF
eukprot:gnl/TRDRNA2_/TRDRNA2_145185_c0_seq1.p1 gnl/TRDRNA2_/TRDRNA2_145185_c0~~gnl/TRDRNA2_/TRDRNA2_145185_c0_seq1.p1  ORF type:complete len:530 (-),score=64.06 gnl/TRDRNA2_/TRDRNA2_145185_c0_seq1:224-1648(-)